MIVYNAGRAWFAMKNDAEAHRKGLGLPPSGTIKVTITDRDQLAGLLNGLCGITGETQASIAASVEPEVITNNLVATDDEIPDCVPRFLRDSWAKLMKGKSE